MADNLFQDDLNRRSALESHIEAQAAISGVTLQELFSDAFIQRHTRFTGLQVMIDSGSLVDTNGEGFEGPRWNDFIEQFTDFGNWQEMLDAAAERCNGTGKTTVTVSNRPLVTAHPNLLP